MKNFFNVADETLAPFLSRNDFDSSLVHHLLFQEKILIHEGYLGDSTLLFFHIEEATRDDRSPLFLEALKEGLIIPALREIGENPVTHLFDRWEKYYTLDFPILRPERIGTRVALTRALEDSFERGTQPYGWPSDQALGLEERYLQLLRSHLQGDDPRASDPAASKLWEETRDWREKGIEAAASRMQAKGRPGVSRTEITNIVGELFGFSHTTDGSQTHQILAASKERPAAGAFMRWVTQLHHLAQADFFEAAVHFPIYDLNQDFIATSILSGNGGDSGTDCERFRCEVQLPPPEKIAKIAAKDLLAIRKEYGEAFFWAVEEWSKSPNGYTHERVKHALLQYANRLCRKYSPDSLYDLELSTSPNAVPDFKKRFAEDFLGMFPDTVSSVIKFLGSCKTTGQWIINKQNYTAKNQKIDISLPRSVG